MQKYIPSKVVLLCIPGAILSEGSHDGSLWCRWWQQVEFYDKNKKQIAKEELTPKDLNNKNTLLKNIAAAVGGKTNRA